MGQFDRENSLVVLVARGTLSAEERTKFEELLSAELEWDYVFAQMKRHKLFPLFASHLQSSRTAKNLEAVLNEVKNNFTKRVSCSRILDTELCRIATFLAERDITYAILKGPILSHEIYDNPDKRTYSDIDILVKKSDTDAVSNILKEQGYVQGKYDKEKEEIVTEKGEIVPALRRDVIWCSMYMHQIYPFSKLIDQCLCVVDVQKEFIPPSRKKDHSLLSISFPDNSECWQTLGTIELNDQPISTLNWKYFGSIPFLQKH